MLGEEIGSEQGKITARRVLNVDNGAQVEISFEAMGKLLGVEMKNIGSYTSRVRADGTLYGEGQGVVMGANGEMATWHGNGTGVFGKTGGISFRGALHFESQGATLKRLNQCAVVYEHEVDADGNTKDKMWEWR